LLWVIALIFFATLMDLTFLLEENICPETQELFQSNFEIFPLRKSFMNQFNHLRDCQKKNHFLSTSFCLDNSLKDYFFHTNKLVNYIQLTYMLLWSGKNDLVWRGSLYENSVMTFLIKKRISAELFFDKMASLYIGETWIRALSNGGDQQVGTSWLE